MAAQPSSTGTVGRVTEKASEEPRGAVIGTNPAAGKLVPASAEVDLVLSSGPAQVTAPDVVGQNYAVARAMLEQLGLALGEVTFDSTAVQPPNTIIAQSLGRLPCASLPAIRSPACAATTASPSCPGCGPR